MEDTTACVEDVVGVDEMFAVYQTGAQREDVVPLIGSHEAKALGYPLVQ